VSGKSGQVDECDRCHKTYQKTHIEAHPLTPVLSLVSYCADVFLEETLRAELGQLPKGMFARMRRTPFCVKPS
jgi:hypothetical protein